MGFTVLETPLQSDISEAVLTMDGIATGDQSVPTLSSTYLPLPIMHRGFSVTSRLLLASRNNGMGIDVTGAQSAARKVAEGLETLLVRGDFAFGPNAHMYGYTTFPSRHTYTFLNDWTNPTTTVDEIEADVMAMRALARTSNYYGPYMLYYSSDLDVAMQRRINTIDDKRLLNSLTGITGIDGVVELPMLPVNTAILIQMTSDVVRLVKGMDITTVDWEEMGGLNLRFSVMTIQVPQLFADYSGKCGIVHGTNP
jgi:uncharacterized linocin/CFP29 family protein